MTSEPYALTLAGAIDALSNGALSCTALTQSLPIARLTDANVQAWAWLDREHALAGRDDARAAGGRSRSGVPIGVIHRRDRRHADADGFADLRRRNTRA
jgi:hypothetical protein